MPLTSAYFQVTRDQLISLPSVYHTLCDIVSSPLTLAAQQQQQNAAVVARGLQSRLATNESQASAPASRRNSSSNVAVALDVQEQDADRSEQEAVEAKMELQRSEAAWGTCRSLAAKILRNLILTDPEALFSSPTSPRSTLSILLPCLLLSLLAPHRVHLYDKEQKQAVVDTGTSDQDQSISATRDQSISATLDKPTQTKEVDFTAGPATGHSTPKLIAVQTPREILEGAAKKLSGGGGGPQGVSTTTSPSVPEGKRALRRALRGNKGDDPFSPSSLFLPIHEAALSMASAPDWAREVQRHALATLIYISGEERHAEVVRTMICDSAGIHVISEVMMKGLGLVDYQP